MCVFGHEELGLQTGYLLHTKATCSIIIIISVRPNEPEFGKGVAIQRFHNCVCCSYLYSFKLVSEFNDMHVAIACMHA